MNTEITGNNHLASHNIIIQKPVLPHSGWKEVQLLKCSLRFYL